MQEQLIEILSKATGWMTAAEIAAKGKWRSASNVSVALKQLEKSGDAETMLVFGTFKQPPQAPNTFQVLWMERGSVGGDSLRRAA